jgi:hypothetical protein
VKKASLNLGPPAADEHSMSKSVAPVPRRRTASALTFDPRTRCLALGGHRRVVPVEAGNRGVLNAYIELLARSRGDKIANLGHLRQQDLAALADALDLDAAGLDAEVQAILGVERAEALRLATTMARSRRIGGLGAAAVATTSDDADAGDDATADG